MKLNIQYINSLLRLYSCDVNKNANCNKKNCALYDENRYGCKHTTQYKYAKRTPLNYIRKIINKIRGEYKYE